MKSHNRYLSWLIKTLLWIYEEKLVDPSLSGELILKYMDDGRVTLSGSIFTTDNPGEDGQAMEYVKVWREAHRIRYFRRDFPSHPVLIERLKCYGFDSYVNNSSVYYLKKSLLAIYKPLER